MRKNIYDLVTEFNENVSNILDEYNTAVISLKDPDCDVDEVILSIKEFIIETSKELKANRPLIQKLEKDGDLLLYNSFSWVYKKGVANIKRYKRFLYVLTMCERMRKRKAN